MTVTIEEISAMLADLPPSEWEQQMATVRARENELVADRDRLQAECERWKRRAGVWKASATEKRRCYLEEQSEAFASDWDALEATERLATTAAALAEAHIIATAMLDSENSPPQWTDRDAWALVEVATR